MPARRPTRESDSGQRAAGERSPPACDGASSFALVPSRPYSLARTIARFARFPEAVDRVDAGGYRRLLACARGLFRISVAQAGPPSRAVLRVTLDGPAWASAEAKAAALDFAERALGARTDLVGFYRAFRADALLGPAIRAAPGLCVPGRPSVWEAIVTAVLSQQVNLSFAYSIRRELALAFGRRARIDGSSWIAFPDPGRIVRAGEARLSAMRLSRAKAATLVRAATAFTEGQVSDAQLRALSDEQVIARLVAIKGIGRWTAETVLMRGLARLDAFPAGDIGIVKHLARRLLGRAASERDMRCFSERWRPYRALALVYASSAAADAVPRSASPSSSRARVPGRPPGARAAPRRA